MQRKSDNLTDSLLILFLLLSPLSSWMWTRSYVIGAVLTVLNGYVLSSLTTCAHNYFHQANNWRMYLFNFGGLSYSYVNVFKFSSYLLKYSYSLLVALVIYFIYKPYHNKYFKNIFILYSRCYYKLF